MPMRTHLRVPVRLERWSAQARATAALAAETRRVLSMPAVEASAASLAASSCRTPALSARKSEPGARDVSSSILQSLRPVRLLVVAGSRHLFQILAGARDGEDLFLACAGGGEGDVPAIGREHRAFIRALAEGELPHFPRRHVDHLDVVAGARLRGIRDLVVRRGRPRRLVGIALVAGDELRLSAAIDADHVDLRPAGAIRAEGDLRARRRPGRRGVDARVARQLAQTRAVAIDDVEIRVTAALARRREAEFGAVRRPRGEPVLL